MTDFIVWDSKYYRVNIILLNEKQNNFENKKKSFSMNGQIHK